MVGNLNVIHKEMNQRFIERKTEMFQIFFLRAGEDYDPDR